MFWEGALSLRKTVIRLLKVVSPPSVVLSELVRCFAMCFETRACSRSQAIPPTVPLYALSVSHVRCRISSFRSAARSAACRFPTARGNACGVAACRFPTARGFSAPFPTDRGFIAPFPTARGNADSTFGFANYAAYFHARLEQNACSRAHAAGT